MSTKKPLREQELTHRPRIIFNDGLYHVEYLGLITGEHLPVHRRSHGLRDKRRNSTGQAHRTTRSRPRASGGSMIIAILAATIIAACLIPWARRADRADIHPLHRTGCPECDQP